jgi:hypothetical protein
LLEANAQIDCLVNYLAVITYLENDAVHPDYEIDRIQGTVLPLKSGLADLISDDGYGFDRNLLTSSSVLN